MGLTKYDIELDLENNPETSHALLVELTGSNKRVLDVGCDTGYLGEVLTARGCTVDGFEYNPEAAEVARTKLRRVETGDVETTDLAALFGDEAYDVVIFGDVLEHLRDPLSVLRAARRLLNPGGSVVITTPNVAHGDVRLALLSGRFNYTKLGILDDTHTRFFTRESLVRFLADAGFVLADLRRTFADLFSTEVGVAEADFAAELVAELRADPEALTYQFALRAVPDDATQLDAEQALQLDELRTRLRAAEGAATDREALREQTVLQQAEIERLGAELAEARAGIRALEATAAVRLARFVRRTPR